jgi:tetratricopeptide (TPR) repeat protein
LLRFGLIGGLVGLLPSAASAQTEAEWVAKARAVAARDPRTALTYLERALTLDSSSYEANWRGSIAASDLVEALPTTETAARDSLLRVAEQYGRRAVAADSTQPDGLFALARALGRIALTKSKRERIRYADEVYRLANQVLAIDPRHDGAHHILGAWNAEIMRLSGLTRFFARRLLGAKQLDRASWAQAIEHFERAVELDPNRIFHRLELARVYAERKRYDSARREIAAIEQLPDSHSGDERYRREATALGQAIAGKTDHPDRDGSGLE